MDGDLWTFFGIIAYVLVVAWLACRVALDMDARGKAGWPYGVMTFLIPPLGLIVWLLDRDRPARGSEWKPESPLGDALLFVLLIMTFPWGLLIWLFLNKRTPTA